MENDSAQSSELENLIPAEIKDDEFYDVIEKIARCEAIATVLEIGSSSGRGSTEAFVTGMRENPHHPTLFCMEVSKPRFAQLQQQYKGDRFVKAYNTSSIALEDFPSAEAVTNFYHNTPTNLNFYPLDRVLTWLQQDIDYVQNSGVIENGIRKIKQENNVERFDVVLIDGSEFTGSVELEEVYGAKFILLDDICTFKNYQNHKQLSADRNYQLIHYNSTVRNGFSVFRKVDDSTEAVTRSAASDLPIHFFTIVLNGEPFIQHHIKVFQQLDFSWHWHIVEGLANLNHDTGWSLKQGGQVTDALHRKGLSLDGTTEYLNELQQRYPNNITLYRKPEGIFWDGKREMVNAPLVNIDRDCLLWQVDADELWTSDQVNTARQLFIDHPEKTAAYFWCWYFVGENLIVSSRDCYTQNPQQEWLRIWRYQPGFMWASHEPPKLVEPLLNGEWRDIAEINPFLHEETEQKHLIFQHFSYVTQDQLKFKEKYYGYANAVSEWTALQQQNKFPIRLRQYFSWVRDVTTVDTAAACGVVPIAQKTIAGTWKFLATQEHDIQPASQTEQPAPLIVIDGVFFQLYKTGIARVWQSLLQEWAENGFAQHLVVLDRAGTAPDIAGIRYCQVPPYRANGANSEDDRAMLQQVCDRLNADLFISTYFTTPLTTPSVLLVYDLIPEVMGESTSHPIVRDKQQAVAYASDYIAISQNTARDLTRFFPALNNSVKVAYCGVEPTFSPATPAAIAQFKAKYGITKPYFLVMSGDNPSPYKNNRLFFQAFAQLPSKTGFDLVCTAIAANLPDELRDCTAGSAVHLLRLSDSELAIAYSGAIALIYPSKYEGFGMPVLEAMACGCPVITCANASLPEVAGQAALYVADNDVAQLADALCEVQKPTVRSTLIALGLTQAQQFSWTAMAEAIRSVLIEATLPLNLRQFNLLIAPDWSQPEALLYEELGTTIAALLAHPDLNQIALLIDISDVPDEVDPALIVGDIVMSLLMSEVAIEEPEVAFIGKLSSTQWQVLAPRITGRVALHETALHETAVAHGVPLLTIADLQQRSLSLKEDL